MRVTSEGRQRAEDDRGRDGDGGGRGQNAERGAEEEAREARGRKRGKHVAGRAERVERLNAESRYDSQQAFHLHRAHHKTTTVS